MEAQGRCPVGGEDERVRVSRSAQAYQRQIPDQGMVLLDNSLQLLNRNISSTSEKYRLLQKNIEIFQKEYRGLQKNAGFLHMFSLSGLLQLLRKYVGRCPTPRARHVAGVQGDLRPKPTPLHPQP